MAILNYKTRGNQTWQGKQKVYFCAHPEDYGKYFEKTVSYVLDTLEKQGNRNCALFYLEDPYAERDGDFLAILEMMNLFVMPVTAKLLTEQNPALDVDFKVALNKPVSVLPLMMESGLENLFNEKCGNLQFLDPNSTDNSALSYEDKLASYLSSVIIGDELAEKIRKAFDAYIFLSYRKKDRLYARELMDLIHKNDFCRDIAIWYDEFLTPGEDFNDSIEKALKKSKLFALAVTPSLLEKSRDKDGNECDNYIITTEYPMARKLRDEGEIKIIPAELVKTDTGKLSDKYPDIPNPVDAREEAILSGALRDALNNIALRQNDLDPEHNFFIGLAYLSGIDVEKNADRALELITSAANAGLIEAASKLVTIYRTGDGIKRDYEKAIEWQRRVKELRKKEFRNTLHEKAASDYLNSMWLLGDYLCEARRVEDTAEIYRELLSESHLINNIFETDWSRRTLSASYTKVGDACVLFGDNEGAEEHYAIALQMDKQYAAETSYLQVKRDLSVSYLNLGDIMRENGKLREAEELFREKLQHDLELLEQNDDIFDKHSLSVSYERIADILRRRDPQKFADEIDEYHQKSMAISKELASLTNSSEYKRGLAVSYYHYGDVLCDRKDLAGAEKYFLKSAEICRELAEESDTFDDKLSLSMQYIKLGEISLETGTLRQALDYFVDAYSIRYELEAKTGTLEAKNCLAIACERLAEIYLRLHDPGSASYYLSRSVELNEDISKKTSSVAVRVSLAQTYMNASVVIREKEAEYLTKAVGVWASLAEQFPANCEYSLYRAAMEKRLKSALTKKKRKEFFSSLFKKRK